MNCNYCKSECKKDGKQKDGTQKYRCKSCLKYQQCHYKYQAKVLLKRSLIAKLIVRNTGFRGIATALGISLNTVRKTVISESEKCSPPAMPYGGKYEVDEMLVYRKRGIAEVWAVYGIEIESGKVIGIQTGRREKSVLKKTINSILMTQPKRIYTDGLSAYKNLIPPTLHSPRSCFLTRIERAHLTARNGIKMLNHKTLAFMRSEKMLLACLKLLFWNQN